MIEMIATTVIPALLPGIADGVRGVFARMTGSAGMRPQNVDEHIALMQAETKRLESIAKLDQAEGISQWVANIRALQRPFACGAIIMAYVVAVTMATPPEVTQDLGNYASMVTFYLFGDRGLWHRKRER